MGLLINGVSTRSLTERITAPPNIGMNPTTNCHPDVSGLVTATADKVVIHFEDSTTESVDLSESVTAGFRPFVSIFDYPSSDAVLIEAYQDELMVGAIDLSEMLGFHDLRIRRNTVLDMTGSRESDG